MHDLSNSDPALEAALGLYQRLLQRDAAAPADFAAAFLTPLISWLQSANPKVDPALCQEAAEKTIVDFIHRLGAYDPTRLAIPAFLRMAAQRDLQTLLRKEHRYRQKHRSLNLVEDAPAAEKYLGRDDDPSLPLQLAEAEQQHAPSETFLQELTETERRVVELMHQGERRTAVYAEALNLLDHPPAEQRREVKRVKDRLTKRQQRWEGGHERPT